MGIEGTVTGYQALEKKDALWLRLIISNDDGIYTRELPVSAGNVGLVKLMGRGLCDCYVNLEENSLTQSYWLQVAHDETRGKKGFFAEDYVFS